MGDLHADLATGTNYLFLFTFISFYSISIIENSKLPVQEAQNEHVDKGKFGQYFADKDDMGPYRNPPSVSSMISNSTHMSDYPNMRSPGNDFEAFDYESNVPMPQKVISRRNTKRRTSGGKDLKRLVSSARTPKSTMGKPYPPVGARSARLSRFPHMEYQESNCTYKNTVT